MKLDAVPHERRMELAINEFMKMRMLIMHNTMYTHHEKLSRARQLREQLALTYLLDFEQFVMAVGERLAQSEIPIERRIV